MQKKISVLGSTGSIGTQTLDVAGTYSDEIKIMALSANKNIKLLEKQVRKFKPELAVVADEEAAKEFKIKVADTSTRVLSGSDAINECVILNGVDTVVTAMVGIAGLVPTVEAIKHKKNIALANKETLVTAGHIVTKLAKENNVSILPVDSEHSAIFQSMQGCEDKKEIKKILLTASGGPFFGKTKDELLSVTPSDALKHPNWDMGAKITIDSATMVNKGLEVIEAMWLFGVDVDDIEVLVHRQSIVHSMVEYCDNAVIAQLGVPDMRLPIQYALTYPHRLPMQNNNLDLSNLLTLTFEQPDTETFPALSLAYKAAKTGGIMPCVFNSADEAAVELFLNGEIGFLQISELISRAVNEYTNIMSPDLNDILSADKNVREYVREMAKK